MASIVMIGPHHSRGTTGVHVPRVAALARRLMRRKCHRFGLAGIVLRSGDADSDSHRDTSARALESSSAQSAFVACFALRSWLTSEAPQFEQNRASLSVADRTAHRPTSPVPASPSRLLSVSLLERRCSQCFRQLPVSRSNSISRHHRAGCGPCRRRRYVLRKRRADWRPALKTDTGERQRANASKVAEDKGVNVYPEWRLRLRLVLPCVASLATGLGRACNAAARSPTSNQRVEHYGTGCYSDGGVSRSRAVEPRLDRDTVHARRKLLEALSISAALYPPETIDITSACIRGDTLQEDSRLSGTYRCRGGIRTAFDLVLQIVPLSIRHRCNRARLCRQLHR